MALAFQPGTGTAVTLESEARATIFSVALSVSSVAELRFGALTSGDTEGTVIVAPDPDAPRTATGGAVLLGGANFGPAEFTITGQVGAAYTITLPTEPVIIVRDNTPSPEMGVTALNAVELLAVAVENGAEGPTGTIGLIGSGGTDTVFVGGTLEVTTTALSGNYRGDILITVSY